MRRMCRALFWTVLIVACTVTLAMDSKQEDSETNLFVQESIVRAHQKLTTGLYKTFSRKPGNLIISPWSVMTLLTVTYMVAAGRTANEIGDHLNINLLRRKEILAGFKHINEIFQNEGANCSSSSEVLKSLNGALLGRRVRLNRRLAKQLRESLGTHLHKVFVKTPGQGHQEVAPWGKDTGVADSGEQVAFLPPVSGVKTPGQLEGLVPGEDGLQNKMSFWLFNWMAFQGKWQAPFSPGETHEADFWARGTERVVVPTMTVKAKFPRTHYPQLSMTLLELPYGQAEQAASGRYGLFILLPDEIDGLSRMEKKLKQFTLESMLAQPHWNRLAKVFLPKFKFRTDIMLNEAMKTMGYIRMFHQNEADFSRLVPKQRKGKRSPYVQTMVHRAAIEVNENGTIASASTALRLTYRKYVHYFLVNHPFMFVLRDKTMGINLFIGRVTDPRELS